ncbi:MAG: isochorismatase [Gammaproteobacteria bacterium]|jgi:hypothetical protein
MITLENPYRTRPIRFLGIWEIDAWRMKVYGIAYDRNAPQQQLVDAAQQIARQRLTQVDKDTQHYGVGFIGIHEGKTGNLVFISWWINENELYHHVYTSSAEQPEQLVDMTESGLTACTWDLRVLCFERDAWVDSILKRYPQADIEGYLATTLNAEI